MPGFADLAMVNIDCADPVELAEFYGALLGWELAHSQPEYTMLANPARGGAPIGFGRVDGHRPAAWPDPDGSKQFHLDFYVDDVEQAVARAQELGAVRPDHQPSESWTVMLDPAGHPFCLCRR
ncbi:VOC family protein [Kitasatospora sp. NPDC048540]|uniref:VOC family protein n=1 Tax=Kitasatospora sp. NPDC048540 TaxID=3155634 RepID=UPI0033DC1922